MRANHIMGPFEAPSKNPKKKNAPLCDLFTALYTLRIRGTIVFLCPTNRHMRAIIFLNCSDQNKKIRKLVYMNVRNVIFLYCPEIRYVWKIRMNLLSTVHM